MLLSSPKTRVGRDCEQGLNAFAANTLGERILRTTLRRQSDAPREGGQKSDALGERPAGRARREAPRSTIRRRASGKGLVCYAAEGSSRPSFGRGRYRTRLNFVDELLQSQHEPWPIANRGDQDSSAMSLIGRRGNGMRMNAGAADVRGSDRQSLESTPTAGRDDNPGAHLTP